MMSDESPRMPSKRLGAPKAEKKATKAAAAAEKEDEDMAGFDDEPKNSSKMEDEDGEENESPEFLPFFVDSRLGKLILFSCCSR